MMICPNCGYEHVAVTVPLGLTAQHTKCLEVIRGYIAEQGYPPSYREIADLMGLKSISGIHRMVHSLIERGHLHAPIRQRARSIALVAA